MLDRILRRVSIPVLIEAQTVQPDGLNRFEWHDVRFRRPPEATRVIVQVIQRSGVEMREALFSEDAWVLPNGARLDHRSVNYWTFVGRMPPR